MRIAVPLMLIGALLLPAWTWAQPLEAPLVYKVDEGMHGPPDGQLSWQIDAPPTGDWKWPATDDARAVYGTVQLGDFEYAYCLYRSKPELVVPDRLHFDVNANRDLTDDAVLESALSANGGENPTNVFPNIDLTIQVDGKDRPYAFVLQAQGYNPGLISRLFDGLSGGHQKGPGVGITVQCWYEATLSLGGTERTIRFRDDNYNGRFDDTLKPTAAGPTGGPLGDTFALCAGKADEPLRYLSLPDLLVIGEFAGTLKLDPDAGKLFLTPLNGDVCTAKVAPKIQFMVLRLAEGDRSLVLVEPAASVSLPAGDYRLQYYEMKQDDGIGGTWLARAFQPDEEKTAKLEGPEGVLPFGEPFSCELMAGTIERGIFSGPYANLSFLTIGAGGERVVSIVHRRKSSLGDDNKWRYEMPPPPRFKITLADGEVVAEGAFRYG